MFFKNNFAEFSSFSVSKYKALLKYSFIFLLIGLCPLIGIAQSVQKRNISWTDSIQNQYFEGAVFLETENMLPYFSEIFFSTKKNAPLAKITVQVVDTKFEPFQRHSFSTLQLASIKNEIVVSQKLAKSRGRSHLQLGILPFRRNGNGIERLVSFSLIVHEVHESNSIAKKTNSIPSSSVLSSGNWIKVSVSETGVHKLTHAQLTEMGISQVQNIRIFGYGGMLPTQNIEARPWKLTENSVYKGSDHILFYAEGPDSWYWNTKHNMFLYKENHYSEESYYFITDSYNSGFDNTIAEANNTNTSNYTSTSYDALNVHEEVLYNPLKSGREWLGEGFITETNLSFQLTFPELEANAACKIQTVVASRSKPASTMHISNAQWSGEMLIPEITYRYEAYHAKTDTLTDSFVWNAGETIPFDYSYSKGGPYSKAWLDYIIVNARAKNKYNNKQFILRDRNAIEANRNTRFQIETSSNILVWKKLNNGKITSLKTTKESNKVSFTDATSSATEYFIFSLNEELPEPKFVTQVSNQNLHSLPQADYIIVTHPDFMNQAEELASFHKTKNGLRVHVVNQEEIFNEFSSGSPDPSAIRDFVRMFYLRANGVESAMPKYLLLFGDGSYDYLKKQGNSGLSTNFVLTFQSSNSLYNTKSFVSDDFFGLLDPEEGESTGLLDIGIGRFPARTPLEAQNMVQKVKDYYATSSHGNWRNKVVIIADDSEDSDRWYFMQQGEDFADKIVKKYPHILPQKIYLDAFQQHNNGVSNTYPDVNRVIDETVNEGCLLINYIGHGNEKQLADEAVVTSAQIDGWNNPSKMPVLLTATCEFSRFDDDDIASAGEQTLYKVSGGAVALFTTTRLVYAYNNSVLNNFFFDYALLTYNPQNGMRMRLGDILRQTKVALGTDLNKRNFTLLGDPALALATPDNLAGVTRINNQAVTQQNDTLKAMQKIKVEGSVMAENNAVLTNFNGVVYPTILDRPTLLTTKGNDYTPFTYKRYDNYIYKGKASVTNGNFSFSFVVPKDIRYKYGEGRLLFYATDTKTEAAGAYQKIVIGGSANNPEQDKIGPEVRLFFNDEHFVSGDLTNETPLLIAKIADNTGINTLGAGIGHDIEAVIDDDSNKKYTLNGNYQTELDSYQSGRVEYKLPSQEVGEHTLRFKVWDVMNNSSETEIDFVVQNSESLKISKLFNYPNPFTDRTAFFFYHNRPFEELDVIIRIFSASGSIVKTIRSNMVSEGFLSPAMEWDGLDDFGDKIARGVYFYQITIATPQGETVDKYEKLLLLK